MQCGFLHQDAITVVQGYKRICEDCGSRSLACGSGAVNQDLSNNYQYVGGRRVGERNAWTFVLIKWCYSFQLKFFVKGLWFG
jgi:hypothetical protein